MGARKNYQSTIHAPQYRAIIKELIALRKAAELHQAAIAKALGLTQPDISKIERGERRIDALELAKWMRAVGGSFDEIVEKTLK